MYTVDDLAPEEREYLYHCWYAARVHTSSRFERLQYAAKHFHVKYPEITRTRAYKILSAATS